MNIQTQSVEDLSRKRDLLGRFRRMLDREIAEAAMSPEQRSALVSHLDMIGSIDEDLLRLDRLLCGERIGDLRVVNQPDTIASNDALRERIMGKLLASARSIPAPELCAALGVDRSHLRNVMRPLVKHGRVASTPFGYRALTGHPARNVGAAGEAVSQ